MARIYEWTISALWVFDTYFGATRVLMNRIEDQAVHNPTKYNSCGDVDHGMTLGKQRRCNNQ
ncbi:hypothetical protein P8935_02155 [Telmatobacter sp. DSM 110680]|uniref:Uncharacterized protein n=1 Tax=Telmatobacter sp. DSM 110680 TaxID=3036704 RepID=A0AAU7DK91_9BACT